jgi:phosphoenolpyruvate carboxylase
MICGGEGLCVGELAGRRPLFPPRIELSPDEAEVVNTFWCVRYC